MTLVGGGRAMCLVLQSVFRPDRYRSGRTNGGMGRVGGGVAGGQGGSSRGRVAPSQIERQPACRNAQPSRKSTLQSSSVPTDKATVHQDFYFRIVRRKHQKVQHMNLLTCSIYYPNRRDCEPRVWLLKLTNWYGTLAWCVYFYWNSACFSLAQNPSWPLADRGLLLSEICIDGTLNLNKTLSFLLKQCQDWPKSRHYANSYWRGCVALTFIHSYIY
jgi:hypothetical protein